MRPPTAVLENHAATLPNSFALHQNYPNPSNSSTVIRFALPRHTYVDLSLFNLAGQKIATLINGPAQPAPTLSTGTAAATRGRS